MNTDGSSVETYEIIDMIIVRVTEHERSVRRFWRLVEVGLNASHTEAEALSTDDRSQVKVSNEEEGS